MKMFSRKTGLHYFLITLFCCAAARGDETKQTDDSKINDAKRFFADFKRLEGEFDEKLAELYANTALIRWKIKDRAGAEETDTISGYRYKKALKQNLAEAKRKDDYNEYNNPDFQLEGEGVRIRSERFNRLSRYKSPHSLLIRKNEAGEWLIYEETLETLKEE